MSAPVETARGIVCTSHPEASRVGVEILRGGGNAIDAAIAANAALGVIEPAMCGIGGDLMALVWDAKRRSLTGLIGAGRSPRRLTLDLLRERGVERLDPRSPLVWTVPGCVEGWVRLSRGFGSKPLAELLEPAIDLAEFGCAVPPVVAKQFAMADALLWDEGKRIFLPGGRAPAEGEVFCNPDLAETLRQITADWKSLYRGDLMKRIGQFSDAHGGLFTWREMSAGRRWVEEFAMHSGQWVEPLRTEYRGATVVALPPPTHGQCVIQMLNMLRGEGLAALGWGTADELHRMVEAKKIAFEDRARWIADPQAAEIPTEKLVSQDHCDGLWRGFNPDRAKPSHADTLGDGTDTTYLCAADERGNAISLIQSIYHAWGSGAVPDGLGFCLQNRGLGFSLNPSHPSCVGPGKRPLHTIIPGFAMRDGRPWLCFGVMGGTMQPQGQVQILSNMLDFGMDVQAAGEAPRWRHEGSSDVDGHVMRDGGEVHLEAGFSDEAIEGLRAKGHRVTVDAERFGTNFGGYQGIEMVGKIKRGGSDPRKDGCAMGTEPLR